MQRWATTGATLAARTVAQWRLYTVVQGCEQDQRNSDGSATHDQDEYVDAVAYRQEILDHQNEIRSLWDENATLQSSVDRLLLQQASAGHSKRELCKVTGEMAQLRQEIEQLQQEVFQKAELNKHLTQKVKEQEHSMTTNSVHLANVERMNEALRGEKILLERAAIKDTHDRSHLQACVNTLEHQNSRLKEDCRRYEADLVQVGTEQGNKCSNIGCAPAQAPISRLLAVVGALLHFQASSLHLRCKAQAALTQWYTRCRGENQVLSVTKRSSQADHLQRMDALKALEKQLHQTLTSH